MSKNRNKKHHSSSAGRSVVSYIFAFILALFLTVMGLLVVGKLALTQSFTERSIDADTVSYLRAYIEDTAMDYTLPTNIDTNVLDDIFTDRKIEQDIRLAMDAAYSGNDFTADTEDIRQRLSGNVENFFREANITINNSALEIIDSYVTDIIDIYDSAFDLPGVSAIVGLDARYGRYIWVAVAVLLVLSIVLAVIIVRIHRWAHRGLRFVAYATGAATIMSLAAPLVGYLSRFYERLQITPQYVYHYITNYVRHILMACMGVAAIWLILTLILIIIIAGLRRHAMKSGHR